MYYNIDVLIHVIGTLAAIVLGIILAAIIYLGLEHSEENGN